MCWITYAQAYRESTSRTEILMTTTTAPLSTGSPALDQIAGGFKPTLWLWTKNRTQDLGAAPLEAAVLAQSRPVHRLEYHCPPGMTLMPTDQDYEDEAPVPCAGLGTFETDLKQAARQCAGGLVIVDDFNAALRLHTVENRAEEDSRLSGLAPVMLMIALQSSVPIVACGADLGGEGYYSLLGAAGVALAAEGNKVRVLKNRYGRVTAEQFSWPR